MDFEPYPPKPMVLDSEEDEFHDALEYIQCNSFIQSSHKSLSLSTRPS